MGAGTNHRIYQGDDGLWYYRVRGSQDVGPFDTQFEAEQKLTRQMRLWTGAAGPLAAWPRDWNPGRLFRRSANRQP